MSWIINNVGCTPPPDTVQGCPAIGCGPGVSARTAMNEGNGFVRSLGMDLSQVINRIQPLHPATQLLVQEPPPLPMPEVTEDALQQWYGTHSENVDGTFSTISSIAPGIIIEMLNGITVEYSFNTAEMGASFRSKGILDNYKLAVQSNQRGITTPLAEQITIDLQYNLMELPPSVLGNIYAGVHTLGTVSFMRIGPLGLEESIYQIDRSIGANGNSSNNIITQGQKIRYTAISPNHPTREWQTTNIIQFVQPLPGGLWLAENITHGYKDHDVNYKGVVLAKSIADYTSTGVIEYFGAGEITFSTADGIVPQGQLTGGGYSCDFNSTIPSGAGPSIRMLWIDGTSEILLPTRNLDCVHLVLR